MSESQVLKKIKKLEQEIDNIKAHITDVDLILTDDDFNSLDVAEAEFKTGNTTRL